MKPTLQRLSPMDCMKGLAIIMVVLGHNFNFGIQETNGVALYAILSIIQIPIFVFVSGYFTSKPVAAPWQTKGFISYWKSKVIRLLLPLIVIPCLFRFVHLQGAFDLPTYQILFAEYWFTPSLFVIFVVFYIVRLEIQYLSRILAPDKRQLFEFIFLLASCILIEWVHSKFNVSMETISFQLSKVAWLYKYLVLGHIAGRSITLQSLLKKPETTALATLVFAITIYSPLNDLEYFNNDGGGYLQPFVISLSAICIVYALVHRAQNDHWATKVLSYFGRNSLPIYLTHYFFIPSLVAYKYLLDLPTPLGLSWEFALGGFGWMLTMIPTLLVMHGVQANPYLNLLVYGEPIKKKKIV